MTLANLVNTWGRCVWLPSDGVEHIHPDDRQNLPGRAFGYMLFHCTEVTSDNYLLLKHGDIQIQVRSSIYRIESEISPKFAIGDHVREINDPSQVGTIRAICHHVKRSRQILSTLARGTEIKPSGILKMKSSLSHDAARVALFAFVA